MPLLQYSRNIQRIQYVFIIAHIPTLISSRDIARTCYCHGNVISSHRIVIYSDVLHSELTRPPITSVIGGLGINVFIYN